MLKRMINVILSTFAIMLIVLPAFSATITVTSIEDSGAGTLRTALASASSGDTINFSTGGNSITVYSQLSVFNTSLTIDGGGTQVIGGPSVNSLFFINGSGTGAIIQGLATVDSNRGIGLFGADNVQILDCAIGTDFFSSTGRGHNGSGIHVEGADGTIIGAAGHGNIISGNTYGIRSQSSTNSVIQSNYIGVANDGATPLANATGIYFNSNVWSCLIGGDALANEGNVISGNTTHGVLFDDSTISGNTLCGNIIGLTVAGTSGPGNGMAGVYFWGASGNWVGLPVSNHGNLISGNDSAVYINGVSSTTCNNNIIQNNIIGLDLAGNPAGNVYGVYVYQGTRNQIGGNRGTGALQGNVISGQTSYDVYIWSSAVSNSICGNFIGTSIDGSAARDAGAQGIYITGSGNLIGGPNTDAANMYGNVISGHNSTGRNGIAFGGGLGNTVVGNVIGLNAAGDAAIPNYYGVQIANPSSQGNLIGGSSPALANIISGNTYDGIRIYETSEHTIIGNWVGLNGTGDNTIENINTGIRLQTSTAIKLGGQLSGEGNYISGSMSGINFSSSSQGNTIVGNYIGVNLDLSASSDPPLNGIYASASQDNFIGIRDSGIGNLVANCTNGIRLGSDVMRMFMYGNTICANSSVNIQFMTSGTTANNDKASPTITGAYDTYIEGTAAANDFIEIFKAENVAGQDGSLSYVGSATADGSGNWILNSPAVSLGEYVVTTATDLTNGTSELSTNLEILGPPTGTPTMTFTATATLTPTISATSTVSPTSTHSPTVTPTPTISATSTITPTSTVTPTVTVTPDNPLLNVDLKGKTVMAYPNPANTEVRFLMHLEAATEVMIHIYNLAGERIATIDQSMPTGQGQYMIWNCADAAPGIYLVKVHMDGAEKQTLKIAVVQ